MSQAQNSRVSFSGHRSDIMDGLKMSPCRGCENAGRDKTGHDPQAPCNHCLLIEMIHRRLLEDQEARLRRKAPQKQFKLAANI